MVEGKLDSQGVPGAIQRIERAAQRIQSFDPQSLTGPEDPHLKVFDTLIDRCLAETPEAGDLAGSKPFSLWKKASIFALRESAINVFVEWRAEALRFLQALLFAIEDAPESKPPPPTSSSPPAVVAPPVSPPLTVVASRKVFVVHGANREARAETTEFLRRLQLEPIVLMEQPDGGRTIIEKFEQNSDVNFVVVLLTDDDVGGPKDGHQRPRARQNVVMELGYFIGYFRSRARLRPETRRRRGAVRPARHRLHRHGQRRRLEAQARARAQPCRREGRPQPGALGGLSRRTVRP
jgi:hypothetical protein